MTETGKFVRITEDRGFGFISPDSGPASWVFFHFSDLLGGGVPALGGRCSFERFEGTRGQRARYVEALAE